jgi:hypothetical protein
MGWIAEVILLPLLEIPKKPLLGRYFHGLDYTISPLLYLFSRPSISSFVVVYKIVFFSRRVKQMGWVKSRVD